MLKKSLRQLLIDHALIFDDVKLSSGVCSKYYIDARMVTTHPEGASLVAKAMMDEIGYVDAVGGPELGAAPILGALAGLGYYYTFIVRKRAKGYGLNKQIEGQLSEDDKWVAIVDDVATTGHSLVKAIQTVKDHFPRINVAKVVVLVDREEGARETLSKYGYQLVSIFRASELIEERKDKQ